MANIKKIRHKQLNEDTTLYGEFISSFDQWQTPNKQRKRAEYLQEITSNLTPELRKKRQDQKVADS